MLSVKEVAGTVSVFRAGFIQVLVGHDQIHIDDAVSFELGEVPPGYQWKTNRRSLVPTTVVPCMGYRGQSRVAPCSKQANPTTTLTLTPSHDSHLASQQAHEDSSSNVFVWQAQETGDLRCTNIDHSQLLRLIGGTCIDTVGEKSTDVFRGPLRNQRVGLLVSNRSIPCFAGLSRSPGLI